MANEKKGKGKTSGSGNIQPTDNGAANDAVSDQSPKAELSQTKTTGTKSYSDMLRERTAARAESMKRFSAQEIEQIKSDKANGDQIVQK